jgi:uncharacterized protein
MSDQRTFGYTTDNTWWDRSQLPKGREAIVVFLARSGTANSTIVLIKELWAFCQNRIAAGFAYEWHDESGNWLRSCRQRELRPDAAADRQHQRFAESPREAASSIGPWLAPPMTHSSVSNLGL